MLIPLMAKLTNKALHILFQPICILRPSKSTASHMAGMRVHSKSSRFNSDFGQRHGPG